MKKLIYIFIPLALLIILSIVFVYAEFIDSRDIIETLNKETYREETESKATVQEGLERIKNIVGMDYGNIEYKGIHEIAEEGSYLYKDNLYEYHIDPNTKNFVGMIMIGEPPLKKEAKRINKNEAIEIAKNFSKKCFGNFFDYDVEIKVSDYTSEPEDRREFSIRFKQENELGTYTGYYIRVDVDKYGKILSYHAVEGNYEVAEQKPKVIREEAIDIAYREAEEMVKEIVKIEKEVSEITVDQKAQAMGWTDAPIPPGDSGVYFDTEPVEFEEFKANLDERGKHKIGAKLSVSHNRLEWVIYIDNVEINRTWGPMGFSVIIDAITGEVLVRGHSE